MNILKNTKTYLVGHMQYKNGQEWRRIVREDLTKLNIKVFDPYDKPFMKDVDEGDTIRKELRELMQEEKYEIVEQRMKEIRNFDLNLVDRSDFIIANIFPDIASWGSAEELVTAVRMKKPTFISIVGGKKLCPYWLLGMFPNKYIYNNIDEILCVLHDIDDGKEEINNDRWRLLKHEYR